MNRRHVLQAMLACAAPAGLHAQAAPERIASAWQRAGFGAEAGFQAGVFTVDWAAARIDLGPALDLPGRAHGLLALPNGGFVVVANRPGHWLLRADAQGRCEVLHTAAERGRSFNGHAELVAGPGGPWLFTTETDPSDGSGWLSARDLRSLQTVAEWPTHGLDPHQLLAGPGGTLLVANGGIPRDAAGRKLSLQHMAPSLVALNGRTGALQGRWALPDPRLSIRHLAWSDPAEGAPLLGLALQAEHDSAAERAQAPLLAVWDGQALALPCADTAGAGYAGDIAAGPGGGFVLSAQKQGRGLWWQPEQPEQFTPMAELAEPCALVALEGGVLLGAARGLARWQLRGPAALLRWPMALAPDNHAVRLLG